MRILWLILGGLSVALAVIGVVLPVLPTVPLLLLAAFAFARSSERLHRWILEHRTFGPPIRDWQAHGRIPRRVKRLAVLSMAVGFGVAMMAGLPAYALIAQAVLLCAVATFILTRPE